MLEGASARGAEEAGLEEKSPFVTEKRGPLRVPSVELFLWCCGLL